MDNLITCEWRGNKYTNEYQLNEVYEKGLINRTVEQLNRYERQYTYTKLNGELIVIYVDNTTFGYSTQATQFILN